MRTFEHESFEKLVEELGKEGVPEFHAEQLDARGNAVRVTYPKFLFRGEPGVYPTTFTSLQRALFRGRDIGQHSQALVGRNYIGFHRARLNLLRYADRLFAQEIDMPADKIVHRRTSPAISDRRRPDA
jgi:hypothetical protein